MSDINTKYLVYLRKSRVDGETETIELLRQRIPTDFAEVNGITDIGNIHTKRIYSKILYNFLMFCKYILTQRKIAVFHDVTHGYYIKLQYPVNIKNPNPRLAKVIIDQLGGPDGELSASLRYLNQRYVMPYAEVKGLLTDIGISVSKLHTYSSLFIAFYRNVTTNLFNNLIEYLYMVLFLIANESFRF